MYLVVQIVIQPLFFAQSPDFGGLEKSVELLKQHLLVDLSCNFFAEIDVVRARMDQNRFEDGVNILS